MYRKELPFGLLPTKQDRLDDLKSKIRAEKIFKRDADLAGQASDLTSQAAEAIQAGFEALGKKNFSTAIEKFTESLTAYQASNKLMGQEASAGTGSVYYHRAQTYLQAGRPKEALADFTRALSAPPLMGENVPILELSDSMRHSAQEQVATLRASLANGSKPSGP